MEKYINPLYFEEYGNDGKNTLSGNECGLPEESFGEGLEKGREEGEKKGRQEGVMTTARNLKQMGLSVDQIKQATGLTADEIARL